MSTWYLISVFAHVVLAAFWIGGMLFLPLVVLPGIKQSPDRISILFKTGIKFRFYGWIALGGLFLTGILNMHLRGMPITWEFFASSNYGLLVCYKLLIFLGILCLSSVHDYYIGKKAIDEMQYSSSEKLKQLARWSGRIILLLALIMAFLGVVLSRGGVW